MNSIVIIAPIEKLGNTMLQSPWRDKTKVTTKKIRDGLAKQLRRVGIFSRWDTTCKKFKRPSELGRVKTKSPMNFYEMMGA